MSQIKTQNLLINQRKAKIICTVGPATRGKDTLQQLIEAGMDVARLNFSHGTHEDHIQAIHDIRAAAQACGKPVAILQDLQGPKIRIGKVKEDCPIQLVPGKTFTITTEDIPNTADCVSTTYKDLARDLQPGNTVLINDGLLQLKVLSSDGIKVECSVIHGGPLKSNKGINLPEVSLSTPALTDKDRSDLEVGLDHNVEYIALSFVRSASDVQELRSLIAAAGRNIPIIAKIEKPQAIINMDEIIATSDGIMVARGDLGVELTPEKVPLAQKLLIKKANERGIIVITATQMLESMITNPAPTRAEASDVANAVFDDTDALMLSAETASGNHPLEAVRIMSRIIQETERSISYPRRHASDLQENVELFGRNVSSLPKEPKPVYFPQIISEMACYATREIKAKAIVVLTSTGNIAKRIAKCRTSCPIIALSPYPKALREMALCWGINPLIVDENIDAVNRIDEIISMVDKILLESNCFEPGDPIVITTGSPLPVVGKTNVLKLHLLGSNSNLKM